MAGVDPRRGSEADDSSVQSLPIAHSEPYDWKNEALENLTYIFLAAVQRSSPKVDLRPLTPAIREVISRALVGVEERVLRYAELMTQAVNQKRGEEEAKLLQEMEESVKFYFEERLRAASQEATAQTLPPQSVASLVHQDLHIRALERCHSLLLRDLIVRESSLLDGLVQAHLMSMASGEEVRKKPTERERNLEVLRLARGLTLQQFTASFLPALREAGLEILADKLESTMEELRGTSRSDSVPRCQVCHLRSRISLRRVAGPLLERRLVSYDFYDDLVKDTMSSTQAWRQLFRHVGHTQRLLPVLSKEYPGVVEEMEKRDISSLECPCLMPADLLSPPPVPHLPDLPSDIARVSDLVTTLYPKKLAMPEYAMSSATRGICWVVENSDYAETLVQPRMTAKYGGTTTPLVEEFQQLGFQVLRHSNLAAPQLMEEARKLAALDHSQHDCFACIVRSRNSGPDKILCSDSALVDVQDLMGVFSASRSSSLAGKPKIFYVPSSRGEAPQGGVAAAGGNGGEVHPDGADFLLIQTALPGFLHQSYTSTGVPVHTKILGGVLHSHSHSLDLLSCLALANSQYAHAVGRAGVHFTAPVTSTLRKSLVLRPLP